MVKKQKGIEWKIGLLPPCLPAAHPLGHLGALCGASARAAPVGPYQKHPQFRGQESAEVIKGEKNALQYSPPSYRFPPVRSSE